MLPLDLITELLANYRAEFVYLYPPKLLPGSRDTHLPLIKDVAMNV